MKARSGTPLNTSVADAAAAAATPNGTASSASDRVHDLSVLRMPIGTSISGFAHVHQAFERGTAEIQQMLGNECDLIFECRVCRNIFRSLANFLSHKRIYCTDRFGRQKHCHFQQDDSGDVDGDAAATIVRRLDADCTQIVQLEKDFAEARPTTVLGAKGAFRDLSSVIERLRRREGASRALIVQPVKQELKVEKNPQMPVPAPANAMSIPGDQSPTVMLQLDRIASSSAAVFQTLRCDDPARPDTDGPSALSADSIKTDVLELHYLQQNGPVMVLDAAGKAMPAETGLSPSELQATAADAAMTFLDGQRVVCSMCKMNFGTDKTLQLHVQKYHVPSTYVYPCPSCTRTFLRPSAIMQHLNVDHKKSIRRLRQMRESILRRRTRISQIPVKGPSRELARLQQSEKAAAAADAAQRRTTWPDNYTGIMTDTLVGSAAADVVLGTAAAAAAAGLTNGGVVAKTHASLCTFCGKAFERRAALSTHLKTCHAKLAQSGSGNGMATGQLDDESNSNSMDSFMAMVNREKSMHARAHELEQIELFKREAERPKQQAPTVECPASIQAETAADVAPKPLPHRRKRSHARKSAQTAMQLSGDMDVQWDVENGVTNSSNSSNYTVDQCTHPAETAELDADSEETNAALNRHKRSKMQLPQSCSSLSAAVASVAAADDVECTGDAVASTPMSPDIDIEQRPTDCTICDKKFANLSNLRRHVAMFHYREKKFACRLCAFKAYRKVDVLNHITSAHPLARQAGASGGSSADFSLEAASVDGADGAESTADCSDLVALIEVDKNKYSEERGRAVAAAVERMNERTIGPDEENGCSPRNGVASDGDGDSRPEIIIPLLDELDEVDFDVIPMEEFTMVRSKQSSTLVTDGTVPSKIRTSAKPPKAPSKPSAPIRRRGRPKGTTKSALLTSRRSTKSAMLPLTQPQTPADTSQAPAELPPPTPIAESTDDATAVVEATVAKLLRHASSNSTSSSEDAISSGRIRPIRNRVKTANKDFVYDMSNLNDVRHYAPILGRNHHRRKAAIGTTIASRTAATVTVTSMPTADAAEAAELQPGEKLAATTTAPANNTDKVSHSAQTAASTPSTDAVVDAVAAVATPIIANIPGAAMIMAQHAVGQHRACFNRPPELPVSHAIVPAKIIALRRSEGAVEWRVVEPGVATTLANTTAATSDGSASPTRRSSNEQLLDMLTVKRHDTLMDKYHTVAKQTPRRQQKTLSAGAVPAARTGTTIGRKRKSDVAAASAVLAAASAAAAAAVRAAEPNIINGTSTATAGNEQERRTLTMDGDNNYNQNQTTTQNVPAPLTPSKQRLTAVERLAEIKERKLQETLRMLHIAGSDSDGATDWRTSDSH